MRISFIFVFVLILFLYHSTFALDGKVVKVTDGDTVRVLDTQNIQHRVRLYGIDAPEKRQAFGSRSRDALAALVAGKTIHVDEYGTDKYGRVLGIVFADGVNANRQQVSDGMAWVYTRYCREFFCNEWKALENIARDSKIGIWLDKEPVPPWIWRKSKK